MSSRRIVSNSALVLSGEIIERILRLALVIVSARQLGDVAYGKFTFAIGFTNLFLILADGGIHQLLVREIARKPGETGRLIGNAITLKIILSVVTMAFIYLFAQLTGKPETDLLAVYILGCAMIASSFAEFFASVFRGHQRMTYDVASTLLLGAVINGVGMTVLFLGYDFITLACVYLGAQIVRLLYCFTVVHKVFVPVRFVFERETIVYLVKEGLPFGILYFFALIYTHVDTTMLSLMVDDQAVGWYNASYRLIFAMLFIPVGAMKAVFPAMSLYYKESRDAFTVLFERSYKMMFVTGFTLATFIFLFADDIVRIIFGSEYAAAADALKILVWSTAILFIGTVQTHATRASNNQGFTARVVASSAVLNVLLNFILIPKYSLYGAAFATLASELFTFLFHSRFLATKLVMPPFFKLAPKIILICLVMMSYVFVTNGLSLYITVPTTLLVGLFTLLITRYFSKEELDFFKKLLKSPKDVAIS